MCSMTVNYGLIPYSYLYWPACPHWPTSSLLCGWLRKDCLSSSKLPADSMNTETSLLYQTCKVAFMIIVPINNDGCEPGAQTVHLADLQAQTCRFGSTVTLQEEKGLRHSAWLPAVSVWMLESLHSGFSSCRQTMSADLSWWISTWMRKRRIERDAHADVTLHHLSGDTFSSPESFSDVVLLISTWLLDMLESNLDDSEIHKKKANIIWNDDCRNFDI